MPKTQDKLTDDVSRESAANKHRARSAQTRLSFIRAAQQLYAERSIDAVSLNEITVAAGQKNRNALQYHFGNRDGLLQAIVDSHASQIQIIRDDYLTRDPGEELSAAQASARALVMPIVDYIGVNPEAVHYIKILSQLAALSSAQSNPASESNLSFQDHPQLNKLMRAALRHLQPAEAQRRAFLCVSITFHSLADICRAYDRPDTASVLKNQAAMFEQVVCTIEALLAAPARA